MTIVPGPRWIIRCAFREQRNDKGPHAKQVANRLERGQDDIAHENRLAGFVDVVLKEDAMAEKAGV